MKQTKHLMPIECNNNARKEILDYIKKAGDRKVYISELAEELMIDFELIEEIMKELECPTK